ncbi:MAG TPA: site-2 protease family protein [Candidatus Hydrogenedentes bacterium]|nr:site-2 protease family protein [Candidatus Hydrogenedentota bacterium]HOS03331.1 site-2 protease family protein [Candidatus Hydrogenedentota bacterium]
MKWSWRIATVFGIGVYLHFTFLILMFFLLLAPVLRGDGIGTGLMWTLKGVALFAIVVLHELGHALAARRFDIATRDITLLPIGGVARLERMPEDPKQELVVAVAGPAVNVVLAVFAYGALVVSSAAELHRGPVANLFLDPGVPVFLWLLGVNVALAAFNLIPAFPMDGGRVLRALLAMRTDYVRATHVAAYIGQGMALLFILFGLLQGNPFIMFIALFVWMGATEEASMVQMRSALSGIPAWRAMITNFQALAPSDTLKTAVDHVIAGFQQDFPVLDGGNLVGVLTRSDLLAGLADAGPEGAVGDTMVRDFQTANPADMLDGVFVRIQECKCRTIPVVANGILVGILTAENLGEFMMVQSALRGSGSSKAMLRRF